MKGTVKFYQQREFHQFVADAYPNLIQLKKEEKREAFNELILKIMPSIKKYINGRLNMAIKKGHFSKNKYNADEFIDQLFIEVYDHIGEVNMAKDFYQWLFKKADQLLEDTIIEENFDDTFFENIEDYSKPEWDKMQEKFTVDGGGDLVMLDELDDITYKSKDYTLNQVFIEDDEQDYIDKLDKKLSETEAQKHMLMILHELPIQMQSVFELYSNYKFDINEISKIKGITAKEVHQLMEDTRKSLRTSFLRRYLNDNE